MHFRFEFFSFFFFLEEKVLDFWILAFIWYGGD